MVADLPDAPVELLRGPRIRLAVDPARRLSCELPQGRKAARVNGLWRVRGVPYTGSQLERWKADGVVRLVQRPSPYRPRGSACPPSAGLRRAAVQEARARPHPRKALQRAA